MDDALIAALQARATVILTKLQQLAPLLQDYAQLREEHEHITILLRKYGVGDAVQAPQTFPPPRYAVRHSPGDADRALHKVLNTGGRYRISELVHHIKANLGETYAHGTIELALKRGRTSLYRREGKYWSLTPPVPPLPGGEDLT